MNGVLTEDSWSNTSSPNIAAAHSPPAGSSPTSRRSNAIQPPALTTSLGSAPYQSLSAGARIGYTPSPATSLSSPFSQGQSPYLPSPASALPGASPMASRIPSSSYSAPYNPQEWAPLSGGGSPQIAHMAHPQRSNVVRVVQPPPRSSDTQLSPPPPYTPRHQATSPSEPPSLAAVSPRPGRSNDITGQPQDGHSLGYRNQSSHSRPVSMISLNDGSTNWQSAYLNHPPPPPPGGSRSSSRANIDHHQGGGFDSGLGISRPGSTASQYPVASQQQSPYGYAENHQRYDIPQQAPSSKRAASTGALQSNSSSRASSTSHSRSPPRTSWEPGMPLPPPPPGPPPLRSQSASGSSDASSRRVIQPSRQRGPPVLGTALDRVPPTPADWVDEAIPKRKLNDNQSLHVNTEISSPSLRQNIDSGESSSSHRPGSGGLFRSLAVRDSSAKGIRERRIESRHKRHNFSEDLTSISNNNIYKAWEDGSDQVTPSNLVLAGVEKSDAAASNRRQGASKPLSSARSAQSDDFPSSSRSRTSSGLFSDRSSFSTPKPDSIFSRQEITPTPPFSPDFESPFPKEQHDASSKTLPTPPLSSSKEAKPPSRLGVKIEDRPISHILHLPNDIVSVPAPLLPRRNSTHQTPSLDSIIHQRIDPLDGASQRYQAMLEKELSATNEAEALKVFTDFILSESRIRRQIYSQTFSDGNVDIEIEEVRRKLFVPEPPQAKPTGMKLDTSFKQTSPSRAESSGSVGVSSRPESAWWSNYQPCLSPIASISIENDEMSSRGRPPSRWWESKTGSSSEGAERRAQRSKRESKYMGVPRELREAMQMGYNETLRESEEEQQSGGNQKPLQMAYGPDEYPPEKVGWHEPDSQPSTQSQPFTPRGLNKMDISRLVTLPPPYPRHHPAVNNSHPDLVVYRTTVRSISDLSEIKATRQRHKAQTEKLRQEHDEKIQENRRQFRANIQQQIQQGGISYAEAAEAEAALEVDEKRMEKDLLQNQFDTYQGTVMTPMHAILSDRVKKATECIVELGGKLSAATQHENPNQTQEEGDEKPELLEQLTQLKWLFEAREHLYHEIYELHGESNENYRAVVTLPYKQSKNEEKTRETDAFFVKDAFDRRVQYETEALSRLESFMDVIEENVKRGVETHLSAFWDIAPSLMTLVQQVPEVLSEFQVQIPAPEYDENPSYYQFPMQYLYSLLSHAEKSTYQFIESQINLLCLLHEVKSGLMRTNCKLMEAQRVRRGEPEEFIGREIQKLQAREERELTVDLKERVSTVEGQWTEALGSQIQALRERVKDHLLATGGWEDIEQLE
ncbi:hypothetical protein BGW36DRAFT_359409 [Talaromyces proteolyticus]|uniref:Uncharacterized protein n=1 Tax=Talaromyces proteolyticus TaxID=1131652 RepID=A0AAD4KRF1_9EURO|nr:uncharacterized protein BGW36DRAFT_359409 [Talaromyces proteolyticus]KAH8697625.1 hypothetical protein BGW36DRAFT_359409 [Talaromyces proteolyticus]